jgi:hypothetical protein
MANDLSAHIPCLTDRSWLDKYIEQMGEKALYQYRNRVYAELDNLKLGQRLFVVQWCKPQNLDLFVKVCHCFISEHETYRWENGYLAITHKYTKEELERDKQIFERIKQRRNEIRKAQMD